MRKNKKGFKTKYVLIPLAGVIGTTAAIFFCKKICKNDNGGTQNVKAR